jgi:hypothetical protein
MVKIVSESEHSISVIIGTIIVSKYDEYYYSTHHLLLVSESDPRIMSEKDKLFVSVSAVSVCIRLVFIAMHNDAATMLSRLA